MKALVGLFRFLRDYTRPLSLSFVLLVGSVGLGLLQPRLVQFVIDKGIGGHDRTRVLLGAAGILLSALVASALSLASGSALIRSSQGMGYALRNALFGKVMSFSFENLDRWRTGELMVRLNSDVNTVRMFVRMGLLMIAQSILMIVGTLVAMFLTNARLAWIMAGIMPLSLALFFAAASLVRPAFIKVRKSLDRLNNFLQENLAGAKIVRAFSRQAHEIKRFKERNAEFYGVSVGVGYKLATLFPFFFLLAQVAALVVLWVGGRDVLAAYHGGRGMTLGQLVAFNNYAAAAMFPIIMLGFVLNFISMAVASATRIREVLSDEPRVREPERARKIERFAGRIELRGVSFSYGGGENALEEASLVVEPGEKVGLLGATGAGKSTLVSLIPRFYDPQKGSILIDGIDVREIALESLRTRVLLVLQDTVLLSGTIRENVGFGRPDAGEAELREAASLARALDFIEAKASGWDEVIGERGTGLSGGQRQRIAIARALVARPDVMILDDVTSSLDLAVEREILDGLFRELAGRTALVVSQKVATVMRADSIVFMSAGRIVARGTHEALLAECGEYREIFETQSEGVPT